MLSPVLACSRLMKKKHSLVTWPLFFGCFSVALLVFLVVPAVFGLQNFNQWGGMYDEHWCYVDMYSGHPKDDDPPPRHEQQSAGFTGTSRVFSGPMNNEKTCLMWARSRCGKKSTDGWTILWAVPTLKGHAFTHGKNVCDLSLPDSSPWFQYER